MPDATAMLSDQPSPIPIMDWYVTWAGTVGWPSRDGPCTLQDVPQGVRLAVQPARLSEPILKAGERPWEAYLNYMQVLYDDGRYRLWYDASPDKKTAEEMKIAPIGGGGIPGFTCYMESDDGFNWQRPNLGMYEFAGSTDNNIITESGILDPAGWHVYQVFKDPTAPPEERYKSNGQAGVWVLDGQRLPPPPAGLKAQRIELRNQMQLEGYTAEEIDRRLAFQFQVLGFTSPDGLHWKRLPEPILEPPGRLDMRNMVFYDEELGRYVAYLRGHVGRRRTLRKSTSAGFASGWETPRQVLMADSQDDPDMDMYDFGYCRVPGSPYHLMFFSAYHRAQDTMEIHLAVSLDGDVWTRPERRAIITADIPGSPGERYAVIYPSPGLIPLGDDWWGQAYFGHRHCHWQFDYKGWTFWETSGAYRWAMWKRDRLVALEAPVEGRVTMLDRICAGKELRLNFRTEAGGYIKAELVSGVGVAQPEASKPIEGYSFADCDPLHGDSLSAPMTWKGSGDLSGLKGRNVLVRLHLVKAKLFSVAV